MKDKSGISRRNTLKGITAVSASVFLGSKASGQEVSGQSGRDGAFRSDQRRDIYEKVCRTPFVDTHEHLPDEHDRLSKSVGRFKTDDWSVVLHHYLNSDLISAGMSQKELERFFSAKVNPVDKWKLVEPYWPAVKHTGYGQAVTIAMRELYGVDELSGKTVKKVQQGYEKVRKKGFYRQILQEQANIESCQVNCITGEPFHKSEDATFLMQDLSIVGMIRGDIDFFGKPTGIQVKGLDDWHKVMDWWFDTYARFAVAVKSQDAYRRNIDYEDISAEEVEDVFARKLRGEEIGQAEQKKLEDHCFWYAVQKATEHNLPVKLHTGYYAGSGRMPLSRVGGNAASATDLCRISPETRFVFMHICYPYYEEMISVAKQYANAYMDMCWSWIINPVGAKDFLKKYLVTAPANKILTFGGDYMPVEPVLGHAVIARRGVALALSELVEEGWLDQAGAMELVEVIMRGNAGRIFDLKAKTKVLRKVDWS